MAEQKTREQRDADWWADWRREDFSWDGLAKKEWQGWTVTADGFVVETANGRRYGAPMQEGDADASIPAPQTEGRAATLQDYWRADPATGRLRANDEMAEELITADGQQTYHQCHLPMRYEDGSPTGKRTWSKLSLDNLVSARIRAAKETFWSKETFNRTALGADHRAQLQGGVWIRAIDEAVILERPLSLRYEFAGFMRDAEFGGATFSGDALFDGVTFCGDALFDGVTFCGDAKFQDAKFSGEAIFVGSTFLGDVTFYGAAFSGYASFNEAYFCHGAWFEKATFSGLAGFVGASFLRFANFTHTAFSGVSRFDHVGFLHDATFKDASFAGSALFEGAQFSASAEFRNSKFSSVVKFNNAAFSGVAGFHGAAFSGGARFDCAVFSVRADFDSAAFSGDARFDSAAFSGKSTFTRTTFSGETRFSSAAFFGAAWFKGANFAGLAIFDVSSFEMTARFDQCLFNEMAQFDGVTFNGDVKFTGAIFDKLASFEALTWPQEARHWHQAFDKALFRSTLVLSLSGFRAFAAFDGATLERGVQIDEASEKEADATFKRERNLAIESAILDGRDFKQQQNEAREKEHNAKPVSRGEIKAFVREMKDARLRELERGCRVLKLAMEKASNKTREQLLYRFELQARRAQRNLPLGEKTFSYLYAAASDYGASMWRPFAALAILIIAFAGAFFGWSYALGQIGGGKAQIAVATAIPQALDLSWANVFKPLSALAGEFKNDGTLADRLMAAPAWIAFAVRAVATLESLLAIVLAFLFALAVRRRFQIS